MVTVTYKTVAPILRNQISKNARLMTDETPVYNKDGKKFSSHEKFKYSVGEYAKGETNTSTVKSSFAILKWRISRS